MTDAHIRAFRAGDELQLIALWQQVFPDDPPWNEPGRLIARKIKTQPELLLVAELDEDLVGAVIGGFDGVRGWIHHLAVRPDARNQGIASRLVVAVESGLLAYGCDKVNLQVRAGNTSVTRFYERLGFLVEERVSLGKRLAR